MYAATKHIIFILALFLLFAGLPLLVSGQCDNIFCVGGNVGIGTAAPAYKLDVSGQGRFSPGRPVIVGTNEASNVGGISSQGDTGGWAFGYHAKGSAGTDRGGFGFLGGADTLSYYYIGNSYSNPTMVIQPNGGNVGIGTSTPAKKLEVYGDASYIKVNFPSATSYGGYIFGEAGVEKGYLQYIGSNFAAVSRRGFVELISKGGLSLWTNTTQQVTVDTSGNVGIGTTNPGAKLDVAGDVRASSFYYSSDSRLKEDIRPINSSLEKILSLKGVSFKWKENGEESVGLIAQDVEKVFPELVSTDENGMKSVEYANLVAPLIEAVKEQQKQIEELKTGIKEKEAEIEKLRNEIKNRQ